MLNFKKYLFESNIEHILDDVKKQIKCTKLGGCISFAILANDSLLEQGIDDHEIVEGYVYFENAKDTKSTHTWIEYKNKIYDPTLIQFETWGYNINTAKYKAKKKYTPYEYKAMDDLYPEDRLNIPKYLKEEFLNAWMNIKKETKEVFVNPTKTELLSIDNYIRYIIDLENEKLYVWDGDYLIHNEMIKRLQTKNYILRDIVISSYEKDNIPMLDKYIQGHTYLNQIHGSDLYNYLTIGFNLGKNDYEIILKKLTDVYDMDLSWLNKYMGFYESGIRKMLLKYIDDCKEIVNTYKKIEE